MDAAFRRPILERPDRRRSCSPAPLSCPVFNPCGSSSCHFILPSTFPLLPCVIHLPSPRWSSWLSFLPPSTHFLSRVPSPFPIRLSPKGEFVFLSSPHLPGCLPPWVILCHALLSSLSLLATPTIHHVLRVGPHAYPSRYSVIPGGNARSLPYLEMLSWSSRSQSQEAVIAAVGGG